MLDSVIDWFGPVSGFDYQDDDWGSGIEANLILDLKHEGCLGDIPGHLRISRTFGLKNRILVLGTAACAEISVHDPEVVVIRHTIGGAPVSQTWQLGKIPGWRFVLAGNSTISCKASRNAANPRWMAGRRSGRWN